MDYDSICGPLDRMIALIDSFLEGSKQRDKRWQEERRRRIEYERLAKEARKKKRERRRLRERERAARICVSEQWKLRVRPRNNHKKPKKKRGIGKNRQPAAKPKKKNQKPKSPSEELKNASRIREKLVKAEMRETECRKKNERKRTSQTPNKNTKKTARQRRYALTTRGKKQRTLDKTEEAAAIDLARLHGEAQRRRRRVVEMQEKSEIGYWRCGGLLDEAWGDLKRPGFLKLWRREIEAPQN